MKGTQYLEEIKSLFTESNISNELFFRLIGNCSLDRIPVDAQSVYCRKSIIRLFILLKLMSIPSIYKAVNSTLAAILPFGKDVLYKIKNSPLVNWRRMLLKQSFDCISGITIEEDISLAHTIPCFIVDDTDAPKKGKCMELIGRIFSHVTRTYDLGYKSLNLCYWSGKNLLHCDFSLHVEMGKKGNQGLSNKQLKARYTKERPSHSPGNKRQRETTDKKTNSAIRMIRRAIAKGFKASYILADSWFFCSMLVDFAIAKGIHLITRPKFNNWKYTYQNRTYTIGNLVKALQRKNKKKLNRELCIYHLQASVEFKGAKLKVYYYKDKRRSSKWHAIITTDLSLGPIQAYKIYQSRWAIEVSYKELKQHLNYGQCQSRDFDAQIADMTQSLMAYNYLSQLKAIEDYQSIGLLFEEISKEWIKPTLMKRFWDEVYHLLEKIAQLVQKDVQELIKLAYTQNDFFENFNRIANYQLNLGTET